MLHLFNRWLPFWVKQARSIRQEKADLRRMPQQACDVQNLARITRTQLDAAMGSSEIADAWKKAEQRLAAFRVPDGTGGVNPGDRRALFYLLQRFQPRTVLEVGTHIGASTIHIATYLQALRDSGMLDAPRMVSVDISDVNDPVSRPWVQYGTEHSPAEMVHRLGCGDTVQFVKDNSLSFLSHCPERFDFIFLDGDHTATTVFQEIPVALKLLRGDGLILLHDYFPGLKPLWSNGRVIPGPFLAVQRLAAEGAEITALPLGALPWPTKLGSNVTSLALLSRSDTPNKAS
jgi:predicted O-methyltransferase YrrM